MPELMWPVIYLILTLILTLDDCLFAKACGA